MKGIILLIIATIINLSIKAQIPVYLDDNQNIELRIKDALGRMTLEEKVKLCHAQGKFSSAGVPRLGIPELWMSDGPHGIREEIQWNTWKVAEWTNDSCTAFPALTCLAATWDPEMSAKYGKAIGEEARYREKDVLLGPGVNIYRTPLNGRNFEYMGEDPLLASVMVVPYIQEVQKNGVAACVKHYALNNQEKWRGHINVEISERALHEIYLPAFRAAVLEGGTWSIMGAYNKLHGQHCCHNDLLLNKILKEDWSFDGCVITDWGGAHNTREAVLNGLDIEMGTYTDGLVRESPFTYEDYYLAAPYRKGLYDGTYPVSSLNDKAERILRLIFRTAMNRNKPWGSFTGEEHDEVARTIAEEGIVLLKNDPVSKKENALLPIDISGYTKILVVGENATRSLTEGGGSSVLKVKKEVSPLEALQKKYGDKIIHAQGYESGRPKYSSQDKIPSSLTDSLKKDAIDKAKEADLVIFVGGLNKNHQQDCEAADRITLALPFGQNELIDDILAVNPKLILVLMSGNAVEMPWIKNVPAILQAWYPGSEAGNAITNILCGKVNPSGKLPFSFPVKLEDNGAHSFGAISYPGDSIKQIYKEDILVGYRWHDTQKIPALFPFGHGLSYTRFNYGKISISSKEITLNKPITITIPVKNSGDREGKEIVQLYIGDEKCSVQRPLKELKYFNKIHLRPGEKKDVEFIITVDDLKFYDEKKHGWIAEPGKFKAYVGSSSSDIRSVAEFILK